MTQTFGYFCPACNIRWRASVCNTKDNTCPAGHSLQECYWLYRQNFLRSVRVAISGPNNFKIDEYISNDPMDMAVPDLQQWVEEKAASDPERKLLYENVRHTCSAGQEDAWRIQAKQSA